MQDVTESRAGLLDECRALRVQLERMEAALADSGSVPGTLLEELRQTRTCALARYAEAVEDRLRDNETLLHELQQRSEEQENIVCALQLYQAIFENEPAAIVGIDANGRIIQFNASAIRLFGVELHALHFQDVAALRLEGVADADQPDFGAIWRTAMTSRSDTSLRIPADVGRLFVRCYRLEDISGVRGAVVRVIAEAVDGGIN